MLNARAALAALELAGFDARGRPRRRSRASPGCCAASSARARTPAPRSTTTTPTTRPRSPRRSRRCASSRPRRLIAVFQPHLYSRTKALAERFGAALAAADEVGVLDVYPAREQPVGELAGVSGLDGRPGGRRPRRRAARCWWLRDVATAPARRSGRGCGEGDLLVTIGAGDVFQLADALVEARREPPRAASSATTRSRG